VRKKNSGEFLQQSFEINRPRIRYFCKEGGGSNRDWFSLELKLDDFTSGFQTTCTDMAGGWEEVFAVGSWIGTGAGTSGELNKHVRADEAAENEKRAGEAAAVQANCIWLMSGTTMTSSFLKKSMPRMGPATGACKKLDVKRLLWNFSFLNETPRGDRLPICPFEKGPDGLEFWLQGTMLKVAPVSTKYLSFVNSSVKKINPALAGKCIAVAVACVAMAAEPNQLVF
jgi:hypothetical protein